MVYSGSELSGWQGTIAADVKKVTRAPISTRTIDNLHLRYVSALASGMPVPRYVTAGGDAAATAMQKRLSAESGLSAPTVRAFLLSLYTRALSGKIPESKYDPVGSKLRQSERSKLDPSLLTKGIKGAKGIATGGIAIVAGIAVAGAVAYLLLKRRGRA